jgi:hypothetical protein
VGAIGEAAASGKRLNLLVAMRDNIAAEIDRGVPARELASLSRRLMEIAKEIEGLRSEGKADRVSTAAATADAPLRVAS